MGEGDGLMLSTGVTLKRRTLLDTRKGAPSRHYYAILCDRCAETIGRVPPDVPDQDRDLRVRVAKVEHFRECLKIASGEGWFIEGDEARRIARRYSVKVGLPTISAKIEKRGVAYRWQVKCGMGAKNMDAGYTDTMSGAMRAADACVRLLMERGR